MVFEVLDSISLPGDSAKPNDDAFAAEALAAVVLDGATPVNDPIMPGRSDAAWIAQFGARRLLAHLKEGDSPRAALRHALADAKHSFEGLRRRPPRERYEMPCASMMATCTMISLSTSVVLTMVWKSVLSCRFSMVRRR